MMRGYRRILTTLVAGLALAGCAEDRSDLDAYVAEVKSREGGDIEPLPEFEPYESFSYNPADLRDPFIPAREFARAEEEGEDSASDIAPDPDRPREPLEQYPLDSLEMVGTLSRGGRNWGLVQDPDGTVHQVLEGNHMGQNHGRITDIEDDAIELIEIVRDGSDEWMEREASLGMGEQEG